MSEYYLWIKSFHIIAVISWMAGMLYLPRLYVYHAEALENKTLPLDICILMVQTFAVMERRLLRIILTPAMLLTYVTGLWLMFALDIFGGLHGWFDVKLLCVLTLTAIHGYLAKAYRQFQKGVPPLSSTSFRILNEVVTVLMVLIVVLVVVRPF